MKDMTAVVFADIGEYEVVKRPVPQIKADNEMLVKVLAASICGTDVHILADPPEYHATKGVVLGHEFVGEVVETGKNVVGFKQGDRLICDNNLPCGVCKSCQSGNYNVCSNMQSMGVEIDGVFAQYAVIPQSAAVKISKDTPIERAIFAEPINCVMGGIQKLKMLPGNTVLVLGGGPIGMYYTSLLKANGAAKVFVSEVSEYRAEYALRSGADRVINPVKESLKEEIMKETDNYGVDIVVDAVGILLNDAIDCVALAGQVLLFGLNASATQNICQTNITRKGITVYGSFIGCNTLVATAKILESGMVNFAHLITHKLPLEKFGEGLEAMRSGKAFEVVLYPNGECF